MRLLLRLLLELEISRELVEKGKLEVGIKDFLAERVG
jgi:hypothetical protein